MAIGLSMIIGPAVGPSLQKMDVHYPLYLSILFLGVSLLLGYEHTYIHSQHLHFTPKNKHTHTRIYTE